MYNCLQCFGLTCKCSHFSSSWKSSLGKYLIIKYHLLCNSFCLSIFQNAGKSLELLSYHLFQVLSSWWECCYYFKLISQIEIQHTVFHILIYILVHYSTCLVWLMTVTFSAIAPTLSTLTITRSLAEIFLLCNNFTMNITSFHSLWECYPFCFGTRQSQPYWCSWFPR